MGGSIGAAVVGPAVRRINRAAVATFDGLLDSRLAGDGRAPGGESARRACGERALQGPLVDALAVDLVRYRVADRLLSEGLVEQTTARVLDGEEFEHAVQAALESPTVERLIASAIESRLLDQAVVRLLESDDLWLVVDEIAARRSPPRSRSRASASPTRSPAVCDRARSADAWLEQRARRALRRRPAPPPGSGAG